MLKMNKKLVWRTRLCLVLPFPASSQVHELELWICWKMPRKMKNWPKQDHRQAVIVLPMTPS